MAKKTTTAKRDASTGTTPLTATLKERFEANPKRHPGVSWAEVLKRLEKAPAKLRTLEAMEATGGEPDVVGGADASGALTFVDCAKESPKGRRSLCYDRAALDARKQHKPKSSALDTARELGVEVLDEQAYRALQRFGPFDTATSSWLATPGDVREQGGAIFGDHRFGRTFVYHNGAESYYAARGFRGAVKV